MTVKEFWKLNATCNISPETEEFGWLWKRWVRRAFGESKTFKCEGERKDHMLHYEQVFCNVFERRESKCCAADTDNEFTECQTPNKKLQSIGISPVSLHAFMKSLKSNISETYKV